MTVWSHRFTEETAAPLRIFGDSFPFDQDLIPEEVVSAVAHVNAIEAAGVVRAREAGRLRKALRAIGADFEKGKLDLSGGDEDVHSFVEAELGRRLGDLAGKLHTGRSRNDQVATIYRLRARTEIDLALETLSGLMAAVVARAEENEGVLLPAYTHLQRAQPVLLAHHLLAHVEAFDRDRERLAEARRRADVLPLGAAAGTGSAFPLDREAVAKELGFKGVARNSLDAVADRDFLLDYLSAAAILGVHLSRLAEEIVLWTSSEFGFARLSDRASTGSSIMPQKRNPDGAELVRGKAGRLTGHLVSLLTTLKGLPLCYNKDLQEAGPIFLEAAGELKAALILARVTVEEITFSKERMSAALIGGFPEATEAADWLVRRGVPFREAHGAAARLVGEAESRNLDTLAELPPEVLPSVHPKLGPDLLEALTPEAAVRARDLTGGTAPRRVKAEIRRWKRRLA